MAKPVATMLRGPFSLKTVKQTSKRYAIQARYVKHQV